MLYWQGVESLGDKLKEVLGVQSPKDMHYKVCGLLLCVEKENLSIKKHDDIFCIFMEFL